jgi:hypothetical protein
LFTHFGDPAQNQTTSLRGHSEGEAAWGGANLEDHSPPQMKYEARGRLVSPTAVAGPAVTNPALVTKKSVAPDHWKPSDPKRYSKRKTRSLWR